MIDLCIHQCCESLIDESKLAGVAYNNMRYQFFWGGGPCLTTPSSRILLAVTSYSISGESCMNNQQANYYN